jgi:hypothetical protein
VSAQPSEIARALAQFSLISFEIVALTALPAWLGHWLEVRKGAPNWVMPILGLFGFSLAIYRLWQRMQHQQKNDENN